MKENLLHPQTNNEVSLVRWLGHPRAWSASEKAGVLILLGLSACLGVFPWEPDISNLLAIALYVALVVALLLLTWRRFFKP